MFTGSSTLLSSLIVQHMTPIVNASDPAAIANLQATANALAIAIETWILTAGTGSIQGTVAPGIPTAGSPSAQATTAPGIFLTPTTKLI